MRRVLKQILLFILVTAILFTNIQISQAASTGTVRVNDFYQMKSQEESTIIKEEKSQEEGNQEKDSSDYKDKENKKEDKKDDKNTVETKYEISDECVSCGSCEGSCPNAAIFQGSKHMEINKDLCIGCGTCADKCPVSAIRKEKEV